MQDNKENIDLLIKSLLENAEETVPPHIWDSVSAGIEKNRVKPFLVWRRAAAIVAVAAAIALGVFFGIRTSPWEREIAQEKTVALNKSSLESGEEGMAVQENGFKEVENLIADAGPAIKKEPLANIAEIKRKKHIEEAAVKENMPEPVAENNEKETAATEETFESKEEAPVKEVAAVEPPEKHEEVFEPDVFSTMEREDARKEKDSGVSFSIGGDIQNNGNARSASGIGMKHIKGKDIPTATTVEQVSRESSYSVPISVGLGVRFPLYKRLSIGTGLNYSMMERTFTGIYTEFKNNVKTLTINSDIRNSLHYIGLPLNLYFDLIDKKGLDFYVFAGGTVEKAVINKYRIFQTSGDIHHSEPVKGVQLSAAAGFGVEFRLAKHLGLYIDPSLRYYFDCAQPVSIRTQQPLMMSFEIGLRMSL